jgi:hypothetical protein
MKCSPKVWLLKEYFNQRQAATPMRHFLLECASGKSTNAKNLLEPATQKALIGDIVI